jgi:hypothetical protein
MVLLTAIGTYAISMTEIDQTLSGNLKASKQAFYIADAATYPCQHEHSTHTLNFYSEPQLGQLYGGFFECYANDPGMAIQANSRNDRQDWYRIKSHPSIYDENIRPLRCSDIDARERSSCELYR